jgi:hypothetical protein
LTVPLRSTAEEPASGITEDGGWTTNDAGQIYEYPKVFTSLYLSLIGRVRDID